jgi:Na+/proline symporter
VHATCHVGVSCGGVSHACSVLCFAGLHRQVGGLVKASVSLLGMTLGPLLGVTLLGMLSRRSNWQGACCGLAFGLSGTVWLAVSSAVCPPAREMSSCNAISTVGHVSFFWYVQRNVPHHQTPRWSRITAISPDTSWVVSNLVCLAGMVGCLRS